VLDSSYFEWSAQDWVEHYVPWARFTAEDWVRHYTWHEGEDERLLVDPGFVAGQLVGSGLVPGQMLTVRRRRSRRQFPLGFFDPEVLPAFETMSATPAQVVGTYPLTDPGLYGFSGCIEGAEHPLLGLYIDGVGYVVDLSVTPDEASLLSQINAVIEPFAVATVQQGTDYLVITTAATGSAATIQIVTGIGLQVPVCLGLPGDLFTGQDSESSAAPPVVIISRPQLRNGFRGDRLVIPSDVAPHFGVIDIRVGNVSQLANSTVVPAAVFVETGVGMRLLLDEASAAMDVALVVANQSDETRPFRGTLIGTTPADDDEEGDEDDAEDGQAAA